MIGTLNNLISTVESNNNLFAVRYEPDWTYFTTPQITVCMNMHRCDEKTAVQILKISYGKFQIMGSVIYEFSPSGLNFFRDFLGNSETQEMYFNHFNDTRCDSTVFNDFLENNDKAKNFCHHWNGDEVAYMKRCQDVIAANNK